MKKEEAIKKIFNAGVVGAGGGGFPSHIKLAREVDTLIVNGAECEPLLYTDKAILNLKLNEIIEASLLVKDIVKAKRAILAIKKKDEQRIVNRLSSCDLELFFLPDFYPAGDEFVLAYEVTKRLIPEGKIPPDAGILVHNVGTILNIYDALYNEQPVIQKFLTIRGEVKNPMVACVPVGTSFKYLIEIAGGLTQDDVAVIEGGPMMGRLVKDFDEPVTKTTSGFFVLPTSHPVVSRREISFSFQKKRARAVCTQCTRCTDFCPRYLLGHNLYPNLLMRGIDFIDSDYPPISHSPSLCILCGLCEVFSCDMDLSPRAIYSTLRENKIKPEQNQRVERGIDDFREERKIPVSRLIERLELSLYNKKITIDQNEFLPDYVRIRLKQHVGERATPVTNIGDSVKRGELIAKIESGKTGANIHASIDGIVDQINESEIVIRNQIRR